MKEKITQLILAAMAIALFVFLCVSWGEKRQLAKDYGRLQASYNELLAAPADTHTVHIVDTVTVVKPVPVESSIDTGRFVVLRKTYLDSLHRTKPDTAYVHMPREVKTYSDSTYTATVSGIEPELDAISVYQKTVYKEITKINTVTVYKQKQWSIGLQAGYGFNGSKATPYVGVGVQYNVLSW